MSDRMRPALPLRTTFLARLADELKAKIQEVGPDSVAAFFGRDRGGGDGLLANVLERGEQLRAGLREAFADHPNVGDVRGRGLFVGVEFVADRQTKAPLAPQQRMHAQLKTAAMRNGLLVYPMGGTIDGVRGDHALIAPPFITTASQIDAIVDRFAASVQAVLPRVGQTFAQEA